MPVSRDDSFTQRLTASGLLGNEECAAYAARAEDASGLAERLVRDGRLTSYQVAAILEGRSLILGEYLLVDRLGEGGMGEVLRAVHRRMDRVVAVKILPERMLEAPNAVARFEREVRAAARLVHPNIVTAYDAGEQDGVHFLVTEFVDGPDLKSFVTTNGSLTMPEAIDVLRQAAEGLGYAHDEGIVHRDVKPSNLLVDRKGRVKILDMGIARIERLDPATEEAEASDLTGTGTVMGTLDYMSPEQALQTRNADARSDLYSLGCTLHYLLLLKPVFGGETAMQRFVAHREAPVPALSSLLEDVPPELSVIHGRLLTKDPAERFQSAGELLAALAGLEGCPLVVPAGATSPVPAAATRVAGLRSVEPPTRLAAPANDDGETVLTQSPHDGTMTSETEVATPPEPATDWWRTPKFLGIAGGLAILLVVGAVAMFSGGEGTVGGGNGSGQVGPNRALRFNGRSSLVRVPSLNIADHPSFTIELWAEIDEPRQSNVVNWFGADWFSIYQSPGSWGVGKVGSGPTWLQFAPRSAREGRRTHLAATFDGRVKRLFIDGRAVNLRDNGYEPGPTVGGFYIGGAPPDVLPDGEFDRWFSGIVDEVRVTDGVRYTTDFEPLERLASDPSTVALYNFDEGSGNVARDASGNGHDGTIVDAEWVAPSSLAD